MDRLWNEIIGIGAAVYDTLMVVDRFPAEDTKLEGRETRVQGGGPCATALVAAQKLGCNTAYMGTMGDDLFGQFLRNDFLRWGVDTRFVTLVPGAISFHSVVLLNQRTSSRTCIWNRGTFPPPDAALLDAEALAHAKVLHLDGHMLDAALCAARLCRQSGAKVSYDAGGTYPGVERLLPLVDWLIPSEEFALKITGADSAQSAAQRLYKTYRPELIAITQGARGGLLLDEKGLRRYDSFPVEAKDTNGCGDTFHGAFIAGMLQGMDAGTACEYASAAAAIKCTRLGAREGMPTDEECRAFLHSRGRRIFHG